jgi:diguanylate cyclase (GGDEF)-like protein
VPRLADEAARFGGEEFVVVLSDTELAGALHLAERLREAIENAQTIFDGGRIRVTASVGLAVWPSDGKTPAELLAAADRALYAAKAAGRNCVVTAASLPTPSA